MNRRQQASYNSREMLAALKGQARAAVGAQRVRDLRPAMHHASEGRAGRAALQALARGDRAGAVAAKQQQLWHHVSARASLDAQAEVERGVAYLRRVDSSAGLDPEYAEQISALLERFDLRKSITNKAIARRQSLLEWVDAQQARGLTPLIDEKLIDEAKRQHYRTMTVEDFRGLIDTVRNIEHLGRLKKKLLTARDERALEERVGEAAVVSPDVV